MFRFDTHIHSSEVSFCGRIPAETMVQMYLDAGYSGFVMTDHYNRSYMDLYGLPEWEQKLEHFLSGYRKAKAYGDKVGFNVLLGAELAVDGACNEYLLYGLTEEILKSTPELYALDLPALRRWADENSILIFQAHPYRPGMTRGMPGFLDGIEVFNGNPRHDSRNELALQYASQHHLLMSSGSDAHQPEDVGRGGIETEERITSLEQLKAVLKSGTATLLRS